MVKFFRTAYWALMMLTLLIANNQVANAQTFTLDSTTLTADTVITGLNIPWELKWGPDDQLWMTEREGRVSRVNPQTGIRKIILDASQANGGNVYQTSESGMLGFTFHPQFPDSSYLYIAYTYLSNTTRFERLSRFTFNADSLINEQVIVDSIAANIYHDGARLLIGLDNKIYMSTGDALDQPSAQNIASLNGKILRLNLDGSVPIDNPIPGSLLWSWGHRNPQGLTFGPSGTLYSSEHGPNNDDEINIITSARNYGWPTVMGLCDMPSETTFCNDSNVVESIYNWTPTIAPSDLVYYNHPAIPEWQGALLLSVLKNKRIIRLTLNATGDNITSETSYFVNQWGRLRDICVAPNGTVYIATNGENSGNTDPNTHSIIRLQNLNYAPPLEVNAGADVSVCVGSDVQLNTNTTGGTAPITFSWAPAIGLSCTNCPNPVASPASTTTYVLTATDATSNSETDTLTVNVVNQPGPLSYTYTILDTVDQNAAIVQFTFNLPATDSAIIQINNQTNALIIDTTILNAQQITIVDTFWLICNTGIPTLCSLEMDFCVYSFSSCGSDTLCDNIIESINPINGVLSPNFIQFGIFPNPTNGSITLSGLNTSDKITVMNALGVVVKHTEHHANANNIQLDLSALSRGIYFIQVERNGNIGTQKILMQ